MPSVIVASSKPLLFCLLAVPLVLLGVDVWREIVAPGSALGADPGEAVVHHLGTWGLRILLLTLAVSPASRLFRRPRLIRFRRMIGLWAFAYLVLHFTAYLYLLAGFELTNVIVRDIVKRPYITVGFAALLLLIPLAATSTRGWQRRLGRRWRTLHRLVYPAAIAAWVHLLWLSKGGFMDPFVYGLVLLFLFGERIAYSVRRRRAVAGDR
ncbi:MAG: sulfoxide reductase heme-binding subunit YedZ [Pseudomonadales bacterium]|nr:sulfoxide reductase heme-binding subunit YedZ [Pseudomonadales bacterium]